LRDFLYRGQGTHLDRLTPRGSQRDHLPAAVFALLSAVAKRRPLVLLLEDLHAVDISSLELVEGIASALLEGAAIGGGSALLVVVSTRPPVDERRRSLVAALRGEQACRSFELGPLEESAIFALLAELGAGRRPSGQLCRRVVKATDGNPLFVREAVHRLLDAGLFEARGASAEPWDVEFELPTNVGSAIAERVGRLGSDCRELLEMGTLLGARFDRATLARVSDRSEAQLAEALSEAVAQGLLVEDGVAYGFAHPLIRQGFRDGIDLEERQRLHFRIARHLIDLEPGPKVDTIETAYHLVQSGALADATELARVATQAAQEALARFAWNDAAELLEAAIDAAQQANLTTRQLAELHRNAGLAYWRLMDAKPCLDHYDAAIAGFERAGDDLGVARALNDRAVGCLLRIASFGQLDALEPLERALERLGPAEITLRAQILRTLSECYWAARQPARAEQLGAETLALAQQSSDHRLCAEASIDLGMARFIALRLEDALSTWQAGVLHAQRGQDLVGEMRCLVRSSIALSATARIAEAREAVAKVRAMHDLLQQQGEMSTASAVLVALAALTGDYEGAERHAAEALERARRVAYPWGVILCLPALAYARALRNDAVGATRAIRLLFEPGTGFADPSAFEASGQGWEWLAHWYAGDPPEINEREARSVLIEPADALDQSSGTLACTAAELADALQSPDLAESASGLIEVAQRHGSVFWCGWPFFLPRLRGVAAALTGRFEIAEEQLAAAIAIAGRVGVEVELARSQLDLARLLATRNIGNDRARARDLVVACRGVLELRGPAVFAERADRLQAFLA
jgi:tetratricopeptide (TPR) repeat protein